MSHPLALRIGALVATFAFASAGGAVAQTAAMAAFGPGYTSIDAPLGATTELRIDLQGRIAPRCEVITPTALAQGLNLSRSGVAQADFSIDCNAPFRLRVVSDRGGFANDLATPGVAETMPYDLGVVIGTNAGDRDLGWCHASQLSVSGEQGCSFARSGAQSGWSSGDDIAIDQTGRIRLRWPDQKTLPAPVLGDYSDTIIIELEVRS